MTPPPPSDPPSDPPSGPSSDHPGDRPGGRPAGQRPGWVPHRLIGHRGAAAVAPENTLAALARAAAGGAGMVEVDAKLTADGVVILMHDDSLARTTNAVGPVAEARFAQVRGLDAGSWFGADFAGEAVPTLAEALSLAYSLKLAVNIEIKPCPRRATETALRVVDTVSAVWPRAAPPPLISSFSREALIAARAAAPDLPLAVLVDGEHDGPGRDWAVTAARLDAAAINVEADLLLTRGTDRYRLDGLRLVGWTVNDADRARRLFAEGVDALVTDDPARLAGALAEPTGDASNGRP